MVSLLADKKQPMQPNTTDKMASSRSMWTPQNRNLLLLSSDVSYFSPQRVLTYGCPRMVPKGDDNDDDCQKEILIIQFCAAHFCLNIYAEIFWSHLPNESRKNLMMQN